MIKTETVERWGMFELSAAGPLEGNPFADVQLRAVFRKGSRVFESEGFYDGDRVYRIRFMPDEEGTWTYVTDSNCAAMHGFEGGFQCTPPLSGNHGPVRVEGTTQFGYADGTRYTPFGTTSQAWHVQDEETWQQTIRQLSGAPFNKVRMSVMPRKDTAHGPAAFPFAGTLDGTIHFDRFDTAYFARLERSVFELSRLGIEAELILFSGGMDDLASMSEAQEDAYIRYVTARLAAYRNVWWSLAEETGRSNRHAPEQWDRLFRVLQESDYGHHLRSILVSPDGYDIGRPWLTHASIRHEDVKIPSAYTQHFAKPIVLDDCGHEGDGSERRDSLPAEEMVFRTWEGLARGGFVTHGETFVQPDGRSWSTHGGTLRGESQERIAFLRRLLEEGPALLTYSRERNDASTLENKNGYYLQYFGPHRFSFRTFSLQPGVYQVDLIDTWNMTIQPLDGTFEEKFRIDLPCELYYALRIRRVGEGKGLATDSGDNEWLPDDL